MISSELLRQITDLIDNEDMRDFLNKNVEDVAKEVGRRAKIVLTPEHFKMAWNYEEKNTKKYSFTEAVDWAKSNMPENIDAVAIYKEDNENDVIRLHLCYLDKDENPLLNGKHPHLVVNTFEMDNELTNAFSDKSLIVLK